MRLSDYRSAIQGDWYYREAGTRVSYGFHGYLCVMNGLTRGTYDLILEGSDVHLTMPEEEVLVVELDPEQMIWEKGGKRYVLTRS